MSFTSDVKKELTANFSTTGALLALVRMNGSISIFGKLTLSITTENAGTAKCIYQMLLDLFEIRAEIHVHQKTTLSKNRVYTVFIEDNVNDLLDELSLADSLLLDNGVPLFVKNDPLIQRDYLRGAFLSSGSLHNPEKGEYQLSIANVYQEHAEDLQEIFHNFGLNAKIIERKNRYILYLSKAEEIMDFLTLIGAMQARLKFEDAKMIREMRGLANRQSNFESANINKTVLAAQEAIEAIRFLYEKKEMVQLSPQLTEIARLRFENPEATIKELGEMLEPPLGKSGVNHRLRKIIEQANNLKNAQEEK
ncbi:MULTISPECIES: DNA-binding protein WhiA [unclassified Lactococcus]|uniref:DNA-binding protein WhiA n=1 Tax=unclassified Lactococcus TaxID=2643510 RepID=UPI0011C7EAB9|nr:MULTISPECIES: DNA-binding protein WhiA [unclassified Lactococcus]MQW23818.1 DNA-binding protein WhiA [Lactococcus sp. dk101]TXK37358.1 DNA-binding protein WhiA [Lactococcus sp. dk310]TXK48669.1 DNA-binding protein WhiA [Lactococcus sp. dk322]